MQILEQLQFVFEADTMRQPHEIRPEYLVGVENLLPIPAHVTCFEVQQTRDTAQQTRLAAAVGTGNKQQFAGIQRKIQALKQTTVAAQHAKVTC